jgi:hypothetical protein
MVWLMKEESLPEGHHRDSYVSKYQVTEALVMKAPGILNRIVSEAIPLQHPDPKFKKVIHALLDSRPDAPRVYALDTEFSRFKKDKQCNVSEVAMVDIRTGGLVAHTILDPGRAIRASEKLSSSRIRARVPQTSRAQHVQLVQTVSDLVKQLQNCHFRPTDMFIEYSSSTTSSGLLDLSNLRGFLRHCRSNVQEFLPDVSCYSFLPMAKGFSQRTLGVRYYRLAYLFRILFPTDRLVDKNHSAAVDALQLAQVARLMAELSKPPKDRRLPGGLLEDLDLLLASDRQRGTTNTIDRYLISTTGNSITREEEDRMEDTDEDLEPDIEQEDDAEEAEDGGKVVREEPARKTQNSEVNERLVRTRLQKRKLEQIGGAGNISQASVRSSRSAPKRQRKG